MKIISIEGLDGVGKTTQSKLLVDKIKEFGLSCEYFHLPNYNYCTGQVIRAYLDGKLSGLDVKDVSLLYAIDRSAYCVDLRKRQDLPDVLVLDRYIGSNLIHQMCNLDSSEWSEYAQWLFYTEYEKLNVIPPDVTICLTAGFETLRQNLQSRSMSLGCALDIIERDLGRTQRSVKSTQWAIDNLGWVPITCDNSSNKLLSVEEISALVWEASKVVLQ